MWCERALSVEAWRNITEYADGAQQEKNRTYLTLYSSSREEQEDNYRDPYAEN